MSVRQPKNVGYGLSQALIGLSPAPIISQRAPTTSDKAEIGTLWVDQPNNDGYILTSIVSNSASWVNVGGGPGQFNTLNVTGGSTLGGPVVAGGGIQITAGGLDLDTGSIQAAGNIGAVGELTAGTSIVSTLGDITATKGNIVALEGDVIVFDAAYGVQLSSGIKILNGTGSPNTVVTATKGSLFLRTDGSGVGDRAYINTDGATAWTAITTAA